MRMPRPRAVERPDARRVLRRVPVPEGQRFRVGVEAVLGDNTWFASVDFEFNLRHLRQRFHVVRRAIDGSCYARFVCLLVACSGSPSSRHHARTHRWQRNRCRDTTHRRAAAPGAAAQRGNQGPHRRRHHQYTLGNGLQAAVPTRQNTVTVNITYLVGSRVEGYGETGMAHLLEHMLFKGTAKHRNVMKLLEEKGAQMNGSTWTDRTNYYETLPASQANLDFALELEADRMLNATISPDDLKTEFSVVRNEFEAGENDPLAILEERIVSTAFLWHNYGKSTIGSRTDIEKVPVPALRAFYEKYYQPDNAVLIVSGKFEEAAALASIEKQFGTIPRPARKLQPSYTIEPVQDGERQVILRRNGDIHAIGLAYHTPGVAAPDYAAVMAAIDVLSREPSGRLYKKLVETKLASSVDGDSYQFRDPFLAYFSAEVRDPKNVAQVENILIDAIEKLGASKIDDRTSRGFARVCKNFDSRWRTVRRSRSVSGGGGARRLAVDPRCAMRSRR
jgi:predicted Zn-dependent peptidase